MEIEKWNQERLRFERAEASEEDIDDLLYILDYSNAEESIEETKEMILAGKAFVIADILEKNKKD